jgi:hypothetical protein
MNAMRFRAKYVSASENGDYYQVAFENTDPAGDAADVDGPDRPYLLIQRQFEDPDGGECYVETHEEGYIGHLSVLAGWAMTRAKSLKFEIRNSKQI